MKRIAAYLLTLTLPLAVFCQSWDSLNSRPYPEWFGNAKLGIFVHWGLYSVPAYASPEGYAEWFYRGLMVKDSGRCRVMSQYADTTLPVFDQYKELPKYWHAERWSPADWAGLFKQSGAKYVVLVTKHHDGYCLWDSPQQPEWNSVASGPRRNIVEELSDAVRKEGLIMGFYYSLPEWTNPRHVWMQDPDSAIGDYVDNYMVPQFKDLVTRYKPELIFADGDWQNTAEQFRSAELIDWYYSTVGPSAIVNNRWGQGSRHGYKTPEYSSAIFDTLTPWAECRGIGRSFGYNRNEDLDNYLTPTQLIQHFCELVASGGGLTLNVGPMADGTIPELQRQRLLSLGRWLSVNGEAIYGSRPLSFRQCDRERITTWLPSSNTIDFDWVRNAPAKGLPVDNFSICWTGHFSAPSEGDYILRVEGDDEVAVLLGDDTLLYFNHNWAENAISQQTLHLQKDQEVKLTVLYTEKDLDASISLSWRNDGGRTFVPVTGEWQGLASSFRTKRCFTTKGDGLYIIEFERPGQELVVNYIPHLKKSTQISLLGTTGTLKWKQTKKGTLTIDLSALKPEEFNALDHAWVFKVSNH
jgi:alpha-L-fucosidase